MTIRTVPSLYRYDATLALAYRGGAEAFLDGAQPGDNPYPEGGIATAPSEESKAWLQGWQDCEQVEDMTYDTDTVYR